MFNKPSSILHWASHGVLVKYLVWIWNWISQIPNSSQIYVVKYAQIQIHCNTGFTKIWSRCKIHKVLVSIQHHHHPQKLTNWWDQLQESRESKVKSNFLLLKMRYAILQCKSALHEICTELSRDLYTTK